MHTIQPLKTLATSLYPTIQNPSRARGASTLAHSVPPHDMYRRGTTIIVVLIGLATRTQSCIWFDSRMCSTRESDQSRLESQNVPTRKSECTRLGSRSPTSTRVGDHEEGTIALLCSTTSSTSMCTSLDRSATTLLPLCWACSGNDL